MSDLERITTENNLGIHGDAQTADELAGRGLNLMRDAFTTLDEAYRTVKRLRHERNMAGLAQNSGTERRRLVPGPNASSHILEAQTGAQEGAGK